MTEIPGTARMPARHRMITVAAIAATYLQAVNISLPNAALLYLQGTLSMTDDEVGWVFTSYIAAGAIVLPTVGWLVARFGRREVYLASIALFALGQFLDTLATTPLQFVAARTLQGAASGTIGIMSMAMLLEIFPPHGHARIGRVWTLSVMLGIVSGPAIGGWLAEYHGWHSMFYLGLPISGFVFLVMLLWLPDTKVEKVPPFDIFGFATFTCFLAGLQLVFDRGERLEWFHSPEIWAEATASALGLYLYLAHILTSRAHFLHKSIFRDRNFVLSSIMFFAFGFVLLPTMALTSPMLDELLGYPADLTGYMTIPRGAAIVGVLILMNRAPPRIDYRLFVAGGLAIVAYANWQMLGYSPAMDWRPVAIAGALQGAGLGMLMPSLTKAAFSTLDSKLRVEGAVLFNLSRFYGSTLGVAIVQLFFFNNTQAVHLALSKDLTPYRAAAHAAVTSVSTRGLAALNEMVTGQAAIVSVIDQFKILLMAILIVSPLVLFLHKPHRGD